MDYSQNNSKIETDMQKCVLCGGGRGAIAPQDEPRKEELRVQDQLLFFCALANKKIEVDAHSLTTYKDVVYNIQKIQKNPKNLENLLFKKRIWENLDNNKIISYGLTNLQLELSENKIALQRRFLNKSVLYDKFSGNAIPLKDLVISANHSPHRYYGEIQNRVNTLTGEAERRELTPVFMTITLPSEYHPFKLHNKTLVKNPKYNGTPPKEAVKILTKRFAKLRNDRALRDIGKDSRIYFRVNEPHKDGTPHTHILYYVPKESISRIVGVFKRLFPQKGNDIQTDLRSAGAYIMKYINKTLPNSQGKSKTKKDQFLNAWYSHNRITRFSSSKTLAPLYLYRLLYNRYSLRALTRMRQDHRLRCLASIEEPKKILEIFDGDELIYIKNENFILVKAIGGMR